jgi:hypothetical protein
MERSLKTINDTFSAWVTDHKILKSYKSGPSTDIKADNIVYPLLWCAFGPTAFSSNSAGGGEVQLSMIIYTLDRVNRSKDNWIDIFSDTLRLMEDFFNYFNDVYWDQNPYSVKNEQYKFQLLNTGNATPVFATYDDLVAGWQMPITVQVGNTRNEYQIPVNDGAI